LEFTGERFTPECVREIFYEHWHRYAWAAGLVDGLEVLDCACGEGYGARLLAERAASVHGVDLDEKTIAHARQRYCTDNLTFECASALDLPYDDDRFDAVVSFETLEHLVEHDELLGEFRRVLKPGGFLVLSSPDRKTYSDETGFENEFHLRELYRDELEALLGRHFPNHRLYGQKLMFNSALWRLDDRTGATETLIADDDGTIRRSDKPIQPPLYFIALAAADGAELPESGALSLFTDRAESVYAHYNEEVGKHIRAGELLAEREAEIERLRAELQRLRDSDAPAAGGRLDETAPQSLWQRLRRRLAGR
ncbi:MAG: class I SAM-dependent methyltransferase, partial [Wenzhouxiangellaceae bacterium]